ncbi:zinc-binding dehydrogenase [Candidatus Poribacteria bacterium]|nr:zinc-binding dehydrogenase [Candidatus Poribacteria bacterium]
MKALIYKDANTLEIQDLPRPTAGAGQILIRAELSGICGSDVSMVKHGMAEPGSILGHELIGRVAEIGRGAGGWHEGDKVLVKTRRICGKCAYCRMGQTHLCDEKAGEMGGGYADYMLATPDMLMRLPDSLAPERAVLWNPLANAIHAWKLGRFKRGATVLIMGVGPIGLFVIRAAKLAGASKVIASDPSRIRREMAILFGADETLDPTACEMLSELQKITGLGPDIVFECAGKEDTMQEATIYVKRGGQVVLFGIFMQPVTAIPMLWILKEIDVQAGFGYVDPDIVDAVEMLERDSSAPERMITSTIPLEDAPAMFQKLQRSDQEIKVVVSFRD